MGTALGTKVQTCPESGQEMGTMPGACQGSGCLDSDKKSGTGLSTQVQTFTVLRL